MKIVIEDDMKGRYDSVVSKIVNNDGYDFTYECGFGETKEESIEDLKNKIVPLCEEVIKLFK